MNAIVYDWDISSGQVSRSGELDVLLGLVGMRERASLIGGEVEIETAPGKGTTIFVRVPIAKKQGRG